MTTAVPAMVSTFDPGTFGDMLFRCDPGADDTASKNNVDRCDPRAPPDMVVHEASVRISKKVSRAFSLKIKERAALRQMQQRRKIQRARRRSVSAAAVLVAPGRRRTAVVVTGGRGASGTAAL